MHTILDRGSIPVNVVASLLLAPIVFEVLFNCLPEDVVDMPIATIGPGHMLVE
jgi:hypothetical protein